MNIRPALPEDAEVMAGMHAAVFKGLASERLGRNYLKKFYGGLISAPDGGCFVAHTGSVIGAFICGSASAHGGFLSALTLLPPLCAAVFTGRISPRELPGLLRYRLWAAAVKLPAELESLVVSQSARGSGTGRRLVQALSDLFRSKGVREFCVFTDTWVSTGLGFYIKLGFEPAGEYEHDGHKVVCLKCKTQ